MGLFKLNSSFSPQGDQRSAVESLVRGRPGRSTLMGVTGSGKTYTIAQVIAQQDKPVLVLAPNKTLAAQLYEEFSGFFPENKVCYFVSYYDYYQPESYMPAQDLYIPKEAKVNAEIERLRVEATASLLLRRDTIIIASVSSIYSLGDPQDYKAAATSLQCGMTMTEQSFAEILERLQYQVSVYERLAGTYLREGGIFEISLPYVKERLRVTLGGGVIHRLERLSKVNDDCIAVEESCILFPARHFVMSRDKINRAVVSIRAELEDWLRKAKPYARERIEARVMHDLDLLAQHGYCTGIENYSAHFDGRLQGEPPHCLFDFFSDMLVVIDESHLMIPQLQGMYAGDRARKNRLVEYGFRLPSAYENRPLKFEEVERYFMDVIFVSATPSAYELGVSSQVVEQIIRPTGLVDPEVAVVPREGQLKRLCTEIEETKARGFRSIVTVLTKKMAEDLALYLEQQRLRVCYLHSDLKTPQRTDILHKLRSGIFDCVVGVNLLREGLDLPEVALVAIMDADIEGFLRDKRSLIQTIGRAARNVHARVILFADVVTMSMRGALEETQRRRVLQQEHNSREGITPQTVVREVVKSIAPIQRAIARATAGDHKVKKRVLLGLSSAELLEKIAAVTADMQRAAADKLYDRAIELRDELFALQKRHAELVQAERAGM